MVDVIGQLLAIPVFMLTLKMWWPTGMRECSPAAPDRRWLVFPAILIGALVALQIVPLGLNSARSALIPPPLPGFGTGSVLPDDWSLITVTPTATIAAGLSFLVPVSLFMGIGYLDSAQRRQLAIFAIVLGFVAAVLGFVQVAQGPESALRFYSFTNPSEAVGFFANRNHFAAQLYVVLVLAGAWIAAWSNAQRTRHLGSVAWARLAGYAALVVIIFSAAALARSRAGMGLTLLAMAGVAVLALTAPTRPESKKGISLGTRLTLFVLISGFLVALHFGTLRVSSRFGENILDESRSAFTQTTLQTAWSALPFGTGLGSFVRVYAVVERPEHVMTAYVNRAHNDLAEFLLEAGVPGLILLLLFMIWYGRASQVAWRSSAGAEAVDVLLMRAATFAIALVLLHSLVDYPLRTAAHAAMFALLCGLLLPAPPELKLEASPATPNRRSARSEKLKSVAEPVDVAPGTPWKGGNVQWPVAWRGDRERSDR